ncbi:MULTISPECIES: ABC transporter permease [unclassified Streptomyces]|uniref:ABC transporter permease n=1 Tax=unclassified Streptomyces TaxID=2593676 RepID=UPI0035D8BA47
MFRTALRNVLAHKARLLMTVLAVTLGVAFVSGTLVFTDTLSKAMSNQSAKSYEGVAVSITDGGASRGEDGGKQGDPGISQQTLDKVKALQGVDSASGRVTGFAGVGDENGKLIGSGWANAGSNFAPVKDGKDPRYTFTDGSGPTKADQVALDKDSAAKGKYQVGDKIRVATNGPVQEYTLSGVFTTEDGAVNAGGSLVLFDTAVAQELYLQPGFYSEVSVAAKAGTGADQLLTQIKPLLGENSHAQTGAALAAQQAKFIEQSMAGMSQGLLIFAGVSLFVGIFLIYNTFTMLVAQRTKELALLRAVGANRGQVKRSVLAEAAVVGSIAAVIGLATGIGLAVAMRSAMGLLEAKIPAGDLIIAPTTVVTALVIGVVVTMLAAWLPARRTAKIAPVAAMGSAHLPATMKSLVLRNSIGSVLALIGIGVVLLGVSQKSDGRTTIAAGAFFLVIGLFVLLPMLSRPVIATVRPLLEKVFGVAGKLAAQNALRNPRRTAVTAASLTIGLTLVTAMSVIGITVGQAIDKLTVQNVKADYRVTMAAEGMNLDKSVLPALEKGKGVVAVSPKTSEVVKLGDSSQMVNGVNPAGLAQLLDVRTTSGDLAALGEGKLMVSAKEAKAKGLTVGSALDAQYDDGQKGKLQVGAIFDNKGQFGDYVLDNKILASHNETQYLPEVLVKTNGGTSAANQQAVIDALGKNPAIKVADKAGIRNEAAGQMNTALNIMYGLLGMALIIAVLGVINTLAMSVYERQQEIGMLRAVGLDRGRVKNMIRLEAVVISLFGAVLGIGVGVFLAWAGGKTIAGSIPGYELVIPFDRIGIFFVLAGLVGVLAAMWPARSAARLNMLTAIKTE